MLGEADEAHVEEEQLRLGRRLSGRQEVEKLGEAHATHQVARQAFAADADAIGAPGRNRRRRRAPFANHHGEPP